MTKKGCREQEREPPGIPAHKSGQSGKKWKTVAVMKKGQGGCRYNKRGADIMLYIEVETEETGGSFQRLQAYVAAAGQVKEYSQEGDRDI